MRRLSREALRMRIWTELSVLRQPVKRQLGVEGERMRGQVTDALVLRIMGAAESEAVLLLPSQVGVGHEVRHGKWDVDEPHPHPDLAFADH